METLQDIYTHNAEFLTHLRILANADSNQDVFQLRSPHDVLRSEITHDDAHDRAEGEIERNQQHVADEGDSLHPRPESIFHTGLLEVGEDTKQYDGKHSLNRRGDQDLFAGVSWVALGRCYQVQQATDNHRRT